MQRRSPAAFLVFLAFGVSLASSAKDRASAGAVASVLQTPWSAEATAEDDGAVVKMERSAEAAHSRIKQLHDRMSDLEASDALTDNQAPSAKVEADVAQQGPLDTPATAHVAAPTATVAAEPQAAVKSDEGSQDQDMEMSQAKEAPMTDADDVAPTGAQVADLGASADGGFEATENAISLLHKRYIAERNQNKHLRKELAKAVEWGKGAQKHLRGVIQSDEASKRKAKLMLDRQAKEEALQMAAEKKREHVMESLFSRANQSLAERTRELVGAEEMLNETRRQQRNEAAAELRALRSEKNRTRTLRGRLKKREKTNKGLRAELEHSKTDLSLARTEWRAEEVRLLAAKAKADARNNDLEANLTKAKEDLFKVEAGRKKEESKFSDYKKKFNLSLSNVKTQLAAVTKRESSLKHVMEKEKIERATTEAALKEEMLLWRRRADTEELSAQALGRELASRATGDRQEVADVKTKLNAEANETDRLQTEKTNLEAELLGNATKSEQLEAEVKKLRQQLEDGEFAKNKAEATAKHAQDETAAAQAVAKQLSGTVPRLIEQAQLAHEARDQEVAMRKKEKEAATRELATAYGPIVQKQLDELHKVLPALGVKESQTVGGNLSGLVEEDVDAEDGSSVGEATSDDAPIDSKSDQTDDHLDHSQDVANDGLGLSQLMADN